MICRDFKLQIVS